MAKESSPSAGQRIETEIESLEQSVRGLRAERMALRDRERELRRQERTLIAHISGLRTALQIQEKGGGNG